MVTAMDTLVGFLLVSACICLLAGYLRLITDENGNVDLNSYRFFGSMGTFIYGMCDGTMDLFSRDLSKKAISALLVYVGSVLLYLAFNVNRWWG